jgi:type I restriction enzyme R subunit
MGGKARAMVVTASIIRAIEYYQVITKLLEQRKSQYKALVAFSGEKEYEGKKMKESDFNGFPSSEIEERFKQEPYRILVVANKFQTGYDEKLLHTMYIDKVLTDIKAVQTLSRLNRAHPLKHDTFVLDFANDVEDIRAAFQRYYKTTILSSETDPNKLNTLIQQMEKHQVYSWEDVETVVTKVVNGAERTEIDPILDACAEYYKTDLGEDAQVEFKGSAKTFVRTYTFLAAILPFGSQEWEKLSQFLTLLIPKLPTPQEEDLSEGILESVDYDSYKNIIKSEQSISLEDTDAEVDAVPVGQGGNISEPEIMKLSDIIKEFNVRFGNIVWTDKDKVSQIITELPAEVAKNETYQNAMKHSDATTARIESDAALAKVILSYMKSNMELFKNFQDDPSFKLWLQNYVFQSTYTKRI